MTVAQVDPELAERLEEIKTNSVKPLTNDIFESSDDFPKMTIGLLETYDPSLEGVLCSLTGGEANSVVRSVVPTRAVKVAVKALSVVSGPFTD